jgi:hypothetical protein
MNDREIIMTTTQPALPPIEEQPLLDLYPQAAAVLDIGRSSAYLMAQYGTFPIEVLRIGGKWKVRNVDLRRFLGLAQEQPPAA